MSKLFVIVLAAMLVACAAEIRPIAKESLIAAAPVESTSVVVSDQLTVNYFTAVITMPAGVYAPVMQNDAGVFYAAPGKIIMSTAGLRDGGIYLQRADTARAYLWTNAPALGAFIHCELPAGTRISFNR